jgi:hypothetical protein
MISALLVNSLESRVRLVKTQEAFELVELIELIEFVGLLEFVECLGFILIRHKILRELCSELQL